MSAHAILALALLGFLVAQVATGATGKPATNGAYHRIVGRYILSPLLIITLLFAVGRNLGQHVLSEFSFFTMLTALVIMVTFSLGIRTARRRRDTRNTRTGCYGRLSSPPAGLSRVGMYVVQPYLR